MPAIIDHHTAADDIEQLRAYVGDEPVDDALARLNPPCCACGGDGGWEDIVGSDPNGPVYRWTPCGCGAQPSAVGYAVLPDVPGEPIF